jgi:anti-anti-sigma factor
MPHASIARDAVSHLKLRVQTLVEGDTCCVRPVGELDIATAPLLEDALVRAETEPVSVIELDLSELTFMDSAGIHVLLQAAARTRADSLRLRIVSPTRQVTRLIAVARVERFLPLLESPTGSLAKRQH